MGEGLEAEEPVEDDMPLDGEEPLEDTGVDPMFAADVAEAFPELEDAQIAALQRAVLGLLGGSGAPPAAPPMQGF